MTGNKWNSIGVKASAGAVPTLVNDIEQVEAVKAEIATLKAEIAAKEKEIAIIAAITFIGGLIAAALVTHYVWSKYKKFEEFEKMQKSGGV